MKTRASQPDLRLYLFFSISMLIFACSGSDNSNNKQNQDSASVVHQNDDVNNTKDIQTVTSIADAATILSQKQVPILCYHQLRDYKPTDSKVARDYIVPPAVFKQQMQALADSGYTTILPDQLFNYLAAGTSIPEKAVMITFDDTDLEQFTVGNSELKSHGFKAVYFIMTVSLGRPRYMSKEQVKQLSDEGNVIASHTWDHHSVKKYLGEDWVTQIEKPSKQLEGITNKPIHYFAYPFGLWNKEAIPELKKRGFKAAFQLSEKRDDKNPMFTIRRIIVPGSMSAQAMLARMKSSF